MTGPNADVERWRPPMAPDSVPPPDLDDEPAAELLTTPMEPLQTPEAATAERIAVEVTDTFKQIIAKHEVAATPPPWETGERANCGHRWTQTITVSRWLPRKDKLELVEQVTEHTLGWVCTLPPLHADDGHEAHGGANMDILNGVEDPGPNDDVARAVALARLPEPRTSPEVDDEPREDTPPPDEATPPAPVEAPREVDEATPAATPEPAALPDPVSSVLEATQPMPSPKPRTNRNRSRNRTRATTTTSRAS